MAVWFLQAKAQIVLQKVTDSTTKFFHVVQDLPEELLQKVLKFVADPPADDPFCALKTELLTVTSLSDKQRYAAVTREIMLVDLKPLDFLALPLHQQWNSRIWPSKLLRSMSSNQKSQISSRLLCYSSIQWRNKWQKYNRQSKKCHCNWLIEAEAFQDHATAHRQSITNLNTPNVGTNINFCEKAKKCVPQCSGNGQARH